MNNHIPRLLRDDKEGTQLSIVKKLKTRYQKASEKLEQVNTIALIDNTYKDETIFKIPLDRAEAITRILPNLLIAFGLIGTFFGISNNLSNISNIITAFNQNNSDLIGLVQGLKQPLQDMGVAFSTSLFGISFGAILTIANTVWNTNLAKYNLLAGLEDYLDNVYKTEVEGNTRLDKAVNRMVEQQQEFLLRFHENVGRSLESSFGKAAMQIANECSEINKIATNVYTSFANAAGTISTGATTFEYAANSLKIQNQTLIESVLEFKGGVEIFKSTVTQLEQNNIVQNLEGILVKLDINQQAFTQSTQTLEGSLVDITSSNQTAAELAQKVYQGLEMTTTGIQQGANSFVNAANIIHNSSLAVDLTAAAQSWQIAQAEFANSTAVFSQAAQTIQPVGEKLEPAIVSIDRSISSLQQFGNEVVTLSKNTLQVSESTKASVSDIDRNHQTVLDNWNKSGNVLIHQTKTVLDSWNELRGILINQTKIENNRDDKSIKSLQVYLKQRNLIDAELITVIKKLEEKLNTINHRDIYSDRQNGNSISRFGNFFNKDKQN